MLPVTLKISLAILVLLVILLIIAIKKRKFFWIVILMIIADISFSVWIGFKEYYRTNKDFTNVKADIKISAAELIHEFETSDSIGNIKFSGRIIETTGNIKEINKDESGFYTIVLGDTTSMSSVRCSMDSVHQKDAAMLNIGSSVIIRGACTGFNKDEMGLGSDVILNRCVIVVNKN